MSQALPFDSILFELEKFYLSNREELKTIEEKLYADVFQPILTAQVEKLGKESASLLLEKGVDVAIDKAKAICQKQDLDFWMVLTRRFPNTVFQISTNWKSYTQLLIIKYSSSAATKTIRGVTCGSQFGLAVLNPFTQADFLEAYTLCILGSFIGEIYSLNRAVTKGAKLKQEGNRICYVADKSLTEAFEFYDDRYPKNFMLAYSGVPIETQPQTDEQQYLLLFGIMEPLPIYCHKLNQTLFLMNYGFQSASLNHLESLLRMYEEAVLDLYGFGTEDILQFLYGLTVNVINTYPELKTTQEGFVYPHSRWDRSNYHKLTFLFDLSLKGYLRLPKQRLFKSIGKYPLSGRSEKKAETIVSNFIEKLTAEVDKEKIDVTDINTFHFLYSSSDSALCYVDMVFWEQFLNSLIHKAKNWFASQHGDRFNLLVKKYLQTYAPTLKIFGKEIDFVQETGADLIVVKNEVVYCIECKAYAKSTAYQKGELKSFYQRNGMIKDAVEQATKICYKARTSEALKDYRNFDWLVCTTSQEFLNPIDKYGMLTPQIPKVCTVEELGIYFGQQ